MERAEIERELRRILDRMPEPAEVAKLTEEVRLLRGWVNEKLHSIQLSDEEPIWPPREDSPA
jgi:hypothetical protein